MDRSEEVLTELLEEVFHLRNQVQNLIESFESDQPMLNTLRGAQSHISPHGNCLPKRVRDFPCDPL